jgi:UDP-N-acetylmuramoyl-tripeptide--D-alanyl-D-alanine ligase
MVTGARMAAVAGAGVEVFADAEAIAAALAPELGAGVAVLVKGSRGARMERVIEKLRSA